MRGQKDILVLIVVLVIIVLMACAFVPGFGAAIAESLRCMNPNIQCVRVVP